MKLIICSIYDSAIEGYMRPFVAQTPGAATREFGDVLKNPEHPMARHPEHYSLWQVAEFFDHDALVKPDHKLLARAHEIMAVDKAATAKNNGKEKQ